MNIPFIELANQYRDHRAQINSRIQRVLDHGQYIMGPEVGELELALARRAGVRHCIGVADGTTALLIAMMSLGVGRGDEIITTPFTFIATGEMISLLGAVPVFVDIDPQTYNIDPSLIEAAITDRTKAIVPVSLYGQCADMDAINAVAALHGLAVIEDAAQSFGATYRGRPSCGLSTIGTTSFFPSKPLGCYGDGGACFTDDDELAQRMRQIRVHGQSQRYTHSRIGVNGRLDTIQAAVLLAKLECFDDEVEARQDRATRYREAIDEFNLRHRLSMPTVHEHNRSVYAQFTVALADRERVRERLDSAGIPTAIHYPMPLHRQTLYADGQSQMKASGTLKLSEQASRTVLSLPFSPWMSKETPRRVVAELARALNATD